LKPRVWVSLAGGRGLLKSREASIRDPISRKKTLRGDPVFSRGGLRAYRGKRRWGRMHLAPGRSCLASPIESTSASTRKIHRNITGRRTSCGRSGRGIPKKQTYKNSKALLWEKENKNLWVAECCRGECSQFWVIWGELFHQKRRDGKHWLENS